jgi:hypothetical protein
MQPLPCYSTGCYSRAAHPTRQPLLQLTCCAYHLAGVRLLLLQQLLHLLRLSHSRSLDTLPLASPQLQPVLLVAVVLVLLVLLMLLMLLVLLVLLVLVVVLLMLLMLLVMLVMLLPLISCCEAVQYALLLDRRCCCLLAIWRLELCQL